MKTFTVSPGSELDRLLEDATAGPVVVERNGTRYRLTIEPEGDPVV